MQPEVTSMSPAVSSAYITTSSQQLEVTTLQPDVATQEQDITTPQQPVVSQQPEATTLEADIATEDSSTDSTAGGRSLSGKSYKKHDYVRITNNFEVTLQLKKRDRIYIEIDYIDRNCAMEYVHLTGFLLDEDIRNEDHV